MAKGTTYSVATPMPAMTPRVYIQITWPGCTVAKPAKATAARGAPMRNTVRLPVRLATQSQTQSMAIAVPCTARAIWAKWVAGRPIQAPTK